jgi:threonine dehydratase
MFKSAFIVMAPDGNPAKYRATIKTSKLEFTTVIIEMDNFDQAVEVAKDLVKNKGVQSIYLCAGFTHQAVAMVTSAVGGRAAVQVARGDVPSTLMVGEILGKEGWFDE